ncbi:hypothetical protein M3Y97_00312100 [Aphelenchoides bicaudatus]|nr:hypothetical protein M3Y97_00312100 [Aphelenchoides bicaudatus]
MSNGPIQTQNAEELKFEKATREDLPKILEFLVSDFLVTEPLGVALSVKREEAVDFFEEIINASLAAPLSYVVRAHGEIIAVRLASIIHRPDVKKTENFSFESTNEKTWQMRPIQRLLHHLEEQIWSRVPDDIHTLLSWIVLSVRHDYTRRGIARRLIDYNWEEVRAFGCQGFVAEATAFNSQQLFQRNNYQRLYTIELEKWLDNGEAIFANCKDGTKLATLEYLPLSKP